VKTTETEAQSNSFGIILGPCRTFRDNRFLQFFVRLKATFYVYKDDKTNAKLEENVTFRQCPALSYVSQFGNTT